MKGRFVFEGANAQSDNDLKGILERFPIEAILDSPELAAEKATFHVSDWGLVGRERSSYRIRSFNHPDIYGVKGYTASGEWNAPSFPRFIAMIPYCESGEGELLYPSLHLIYEKRKFILVANHETNAVHRRDIK